MSDITLKPSAIQQHWESAAVLGQQSPRVKRLSGFLFFVYLCLFLSWPIAIWLGVDYSRTEAGVMSASTAIFFVLVWVLLGRIQLTAEQAQSLLLLFGFVLLINSVMFLWWVQDPIHTTNFILVALSGAFVYTSRKYLVILLLAVLVSWLVIALPHQFADEWFHWGWMLLLACLLAGAAHEVRMRLLLRLVALQQQADEQRRQAEAELQRRQQAEQQLLERERDLAQAQRRESLGVLAGGVAHDFNNLLAVVVGNAELGVAESKAQPELHNYFQEILQVGMRGAQLTEGMLAYVGHAPMHWEVVDLQQVVTQAHLLLCAMLPKTTRVHIEQPSQPLSTLADAKSLGQVVINLVTNASEALPKSGGEVLIRFGRDALSAEQAQQLAGGQQEAGDYIYMEVSDTGSGITKEVQQQMFEPFYSTKETGRGLGLAACSGIARLHGGGFTVASTAQGTHIRFYLRPAD